MDINLYGVVNFNYLHFNKNLSIYPVSILFKRNDICSYRFISDLDWLLLTLDLPSFV